MTSESDPFLALGDKEENSSLESLPVEKLKRSKSRWILFHVALVALYSVITASLLLFFDGKSCRTIYTDAGSLKNLDLQYETRSFMNLVENNRYTEDPAASNVDTAWNNLLRRMHIRVTAAELAHRNQTSIALPEGGGYLAWLEVFHELHCIVSSATRLYQIYFLILLSRTCSANGSIAIIIIQTLHRRSLSIGLYMQVSISNSFSFFNC
jgi:Mycotoxin biosynthesis protein UstYa